MRVSKSYTIELPLSRYVERTRGRRSRSERVNELLRKAVLLEQREHLESEAARFLLAVIVAADPATTLRARAATYSLFPRAEARGLNGVLDGWLEALKPGSAGWP